MTNPNFSPTYSTNDIWRDVDPTRCLTDDLAAMDAIHASLPSTYAAKNHTHTGYATTADITAVQDALSSKANVKSITHILNMPSPAIITILLIIRKQMLTQR